MTDLRRFGGWLGSALHVMEGRPWSDWSCRAVFEAMEAGRCPDGWDERNWPAIAAGLKGYAARNELPASGSSALKEAWRDVLMANLLVAVGLIDSCEKRTDDENTLQQEKEMSWFVFFMDAALSKESDPRAFLSGCEGDDWMEVPESVADMWPRDYRALREALAKAVEHGVPLPAPIRPLCAQMIRGVSPKTGRQPFPERDNAIVKAIVWWVLVTDEGVGKAQELVWRVCVRAGFKFKDVEAITQIWKRQGGARMLRGNPRPRTAPSN